MLTFDDIRYFDIYIQTGCFGGMNESGTFSVVIFRLIISAA